MCQGLSFDCCRHATLRTYWPPKSWQAGKVISIASALNTVFALTNKAKVFKLLSGLQKTELWLDLAVRFGLFPFCYGLKIFTFNSALLQVCPGIVIQVALTDQALS